MAGDKYAGYDTVAMLSQRLHNSNETAKRAAATSLVLERVVRGLNGAPECILADTHGYQKVKRYGHPVGLRETNVKCFVADPAMRSFKERWRVRAYYPPESVRKACA